MNKRKILIVEDDKFLIRVYKVKLEQKGYEVKILEDSKVALETTKEYKPDVILLDLIMPNEDGYQIIEKLKKEDITKNIPVFVLSVLGSEEDSIKATKLGAAGYAQKTNVRFENVITTIEKYLS